MNATNRQQSATLDQIMEFAELLQHRGVTRDAFTRAIGNPDICDKVASVMRLTEVPAIDIAPSFNQAAIERIVNYLFGRSIEHAKKYDGGPWYAGRSTGYDPRSLFDEARFRKLLDGMDSECLTVMVLRNGLIDGNQTPAGVLAERYAVPSSYISTLLKRANKYMKVKQSTEIPFFEKRKFHFEDLWESDEFLVNRPIEQELSGEDYREARERVIAAGITTVGELVALPKRQAAELLLGPDVYLPLEHFPRYVHVS